MTAPLRPPIQAAVLTASDRCARGEVRDESGPSVSAFLREHLAADVVESACLPDDAGALETRFRHWCRPDSGIDLIVSTGGTGLSPRDVTPEAAARVISRQHPGLMELARAFTGRTNPRAYLSRGIAGVANRTLIITLPGSPRGAVEQLEAISAILPHAIAVVRGDVTHPHPPA